MSDCCEELAQQLRELSSTMNDVVEALQTLLDIQNRLSERLDENNEIIKNILQSVGKIFGKSLQQKMIQMQEDIDILGANQDVLHNVSNEHFKKLAGSLKEKLTEVTDSQLGLGIILKDIATKILRKT